jgi:hypothetical protein
MWLNFFGMKKHRKLNFYGIFRYFWGIWRESWLLKFEKNALHTPGSIPNIVLLYTKVFQPVSHPQ